MIPISIEAFRFCAENKSELLARGIRLLVADLPCWRKLYNKRETYKLAAEYGIPVPRSVSVTPADYRDQISQANLDFQLVVKGAEGRLSFRSIRRIFS